MRDIDLELLEGWSPEPVVASAEVRDHARAQLEQAYDRRPARASTPVRSHFAKRLAIAALTAAVLVAGAIVWVQREADERFSKLETVAVPNGALGGGQVGHGPVNILVVGSDARDGSNPEAFGTPAETGPPRSDTMFILRIDGTSVRGLWIPRDLVLASGGRINETFNRGPGALIEAIRSEFGITIDHYVEVNFRSFPKIVDELGGVPVYSPGHVRDASTGLDLTGPGCRRLNGTAALQWVRSRHLEVEQNGTWVDASPRADLDRQARQQDFVRSMARRAKSEIAGDPVAAVRLADAIVPALIVDSRFTRAEIVGLVRAMVDVDPAALQLATLPVQLAADDAHVVLLQPDAGQALAPFKGEASRPPGRPSGQSVVPNAAPAPTC